jgi:prevent-host-death family protein
MKSLPVPVAEVRKNLADVIEEVRRGQRVRVTRHGKAVGWIIGDEERKRLEPQAGVAATRARRAARRR